MPIQALMRVRWRTLRPLQVADPRGPTVDGMEAVRFESPEPRVLRRLSDIRRSLGSIAPSQKPARFVRIQHLPQV
jgi:hypothetical protein